MYTVEKQKLIVEMQNAEWLSATADASSSHKRAFMSVTVHYVDPSTYEMRSMVLGVRRFKHSHTDEAIAKILLSMLNEFGIRSKVQNIVTDKLIMLLTLLRHSKFLWMQQKFIKDLHSITVKNQVVKLMRLRT